MSYWDTLTTEQLGNEYSDYSKAVNGFRDRSVNYGDREELLAAYESLDAHMTLMKSTFVGRQRLRKEGWVFDSAEDDEIIRRRQIVERREKRDRIRGPKIESVMEGAIRRAEEKLRVA